MKTFFAIAFIVFLTFACETEESKKPPSCGEGSLLENVQARNFAMGCSTWNYGPDNQDVEATYDFIENHSDIYSEQIDFKIPWSAYIDDTALPQEFTDKIAYKVAHKPSGHQLLLSVSLLNNDRADLLEDYDGTIPGYEALNDKVIEDAYFKHLSYLIDQFDPDYAVLAMETNELLMKPEGKWLAYKLLMKNIRSRIKSSYPALKISESVTLHNWFRPDVPNPDEFIAEISDYVDQLDFVAISFYPFFKGLHSQSDFQQAFDFLHEHVNKPIAFVETAHLAENLSVPDYNLLIESDECEQNAYLETLLLNAWQNDYEFIIWWTHRDYDELWQTFPDDVKDLGKLWRDTGLLDESGKERPAFATWESMLSR